METSAMIIVTRLNGPQVALNPDLIERAEATPDTILTLVDGTKYIVLDSIEDIVAKVRNFRASVVALAQAMEIVSDEPPALRVLPDPDGRA
jgi:flagellar protein FlbD